MRDVFIVLRKELREILRDRRTLTAIALAVIATPTILFVISQVSVKTATQTYTIGYSGQIPAGLEVLFTATEDSSLATSFVLDDITLTVQ